jgi:hypothetical protein
VVIVNFDVPDPVGNDLGANPQFVALGNPEQESVTPPLNPPIGVSVTVEVAELPGATGTGEGSEEVIWKSGAGGAEMFSKLTIPDVVPWTSTSTSGRLS